MAILSTPSGAFPTALTYITTGALIDIWTAVAFIFYPPTSPAGMFWLTGFFVTGLAFLAIGLMLGPIGRSARHAELPPGEVTKAVERAEQTAAANPQPVVAPAATAAAPAAPMAATSPLASASAATPAAALGRPAARSA